MITLNPHKQPCEACSFHKRGEGRHRQGKATWAESEGATALSRRPPGTGEQRKGLSMEHVPVGRSQGGEAGRRDMAPGTLEVAITHGMNRGSGSAGQPEGGTGEIKLIEHLKHGSFPVHCYCNIESVYEVLRFILLKNSYI